MQLIFGPKYANPFDDDGDDDNDDDNDDDDDSLGALWLMGLRPGAGAKKAPIELPGVHFGYILSLRPISPLGSILAAF